MGRSHTAREDSAWLLTSSASRCALRSIRSLELVLFLARGPIGLRLDMARFVPQPDCRLDSIVFITQRAEAGGPKEKVAARCRIETEPASGEHPEEMSARK